MKILFEDRQIMVLEKPSGTVVNRSETTREEKTAQDFVESKFRIPESYKILDFYKRSGIVHRIDKETSGILIAAKTKEAFENLQNQFKNREVQKTYVALVHGKLTPAEGKIVIPVGRLPWNRKRFGVLVGGREAETSYEVISNFKFPISSVGRQISNETVSLVRLYPKTGRTHQIRVHLKYFGHPIFSDLLYAGRKTARSDRKYLPRLFLHASKISFMHPTSGERVHFESELPMELKNFLKRLSSLG